MAQWKAGEKEERDEGGLGVLSSGNCSLEREIDKRKKETCRQSSKNKRMKLSPPMFLLRPSG